MKRKAELVYNREEVKVYRRPGYPYGPRYIVHGEASSTTFCYRPGPGEVLQEVKQRIQDARK